MNSTSPKVLATDLDGTLIPLSGFEENIRSLNELKHLLRSNDIELLFVTGRHFSSVLKAIATFDLPWPDWMICDVGSSIYRRFDQKSYKLSENYAGKMSEILGLNESPGKPSIQMAQQYLQHISFIRLQESEKQTRFKLSFYTDANNLELAEQQVRDLLQDQLPVQLISSVDPFTNEGLLDVLPQAVSKAFALNWWAEHQRFSTEDIIFAGDSGNDRAAFQAGFKSILVSNAKQQDTELIVNTMTENGIRDRLFIASQTATSGVLEGCHHWGLFG